MKISLNLICLLRVVITPSVTTLLRGENDLKQSNEIQGRLRFFDVKWGFSSEVSTEFYGDNDRPVDFWLWYSVWCLQKSNVLVVMVTLAF